MRALGDSRAAGLRGYCDSLARDNALQQFRVPQRTPFLQLLGWASHHGVLTADEVAASTPPATRTRPCSMDVSPGFSITLLKRSAA